jgi:2-polyprenyl-3-methyl-5-hydroxy-6-metoxy-1,4-benzoquinol methylase
MKYGLGYTLITRITGFLARTILYFRKTELDYIANLLGDKKNIRILDYGCNTAYLLNIIKNKYLSKNFDLCGADINEYALKYARKKYKDFTFFNINNEFFNKEKFDVIILSHVLEHIHDRGKFIANLKRIMKKNGTLIIAIPQERIRGDCTFIQLLYNFARLRFENPHVVKMEYQDLNILLSENGLHIKEHTYTHFFYPFITDKRRADSWSLVTEIRSVRN